MASFSGLGQIKSITRLTEKPAQYERTDFSVKLVARWTNSPFRAEEVRLDLDLTSPDGTSAVVPAFYEEGQSGKTSSWSVRFTPVETGNYTGVFVFTNGNRSEVSKRLSFTVVSSDQKGFLHVANNWSLRFDDGEPFRGLGENIAWESRSRDDSRFFKSLNESPQYNYEYLLGKLSANGGNFFRTWMCPWNLPLEWKIVGNTQRYINDDGYFNASAIQRMDRFVDLTASLNLYMMLTLDNSGDFLGRTWRNNNYNSTNGGPAAVAEDFFTDPAAKAQYKDRLRYLVARWGYSPHIGAWEFFNEIDNLMYGLPQRIPDKVITAWHTEMADYLKSIDPYHHLITTSISHRNVAGLYDIPSIDFNQIHIYGHNGQSRTALFPETLRENARRYGKPYVIGEYGFEWDWNVNFDDCAAYMDWDFKRGLWLGLFSPTPILPMSWWWEYFDHRETTKYIARVRSVLDEMLAAGDGKFADVNCGWSGSPVKTLAVQCGQSFFVLLENDKTNSVSGSLSFPISTTNFYRVQLFDPEQNTTNTLNTLERGNATEKNISVPQMSCLVVVASLEK
ncbi:MAG TPA: cellulase family glycosylhydrolase [Verrucomicrobiae bacterium]